MEENKTYKKIDTIGDTFDRLTSGDDAPFEGKVISHGGKPTNELVDEVNRQHYGPAKTKAEEVRRRPETSKYIRSQLVGTSDAEQKDKNGNAALNTAVPGDENIAVNPFLAGSRIGKAKQEINKYGINKKDAERTNKENFSDYGGREYGNSEILKSWQANKDLFESMGLTLKDLLPNDTSEEDSNNNNYGASSNKTLEAMASGMKDDEVKDFDFHNILRSAPKHVNARNWNLLTSKEKESVVSRYAKDIGQILGKEVNENNIKEIVPEIEKYIHAGDFSNLAKAPGPKVQEVINFQFNKLDAEDKKEFMDEYMYSIRELENKYGEKILDKLNSGDVSDVSEDAAKEVFKLYQEFSNGPMAEKIKREYLKNPVSNTNDLKEKYGLNNEAFWTNLEDTIFDIAREEKESQAMGNRLANQQIIGQGKFESDVLDRVTEKVAEEIEISEQEIPYLRKVLQYKVKDVAGGVFAGENNPRINGKRVLSNDIVLSGSKMMTPAEEKIIPELDKAGVSTDELKRFVRSMTVSNKDVFSTSEIEPSQIQDIADEASVKYGLENTPELQEVISEYVTYANRFVRNKMYNNGISLKHARKEVEDPDSFYNKDISEKRKSIVTEGVNNYILQHPEIFKHPDFGPRAQGMAEEKLEVGRGGKINDEGFLKEYELMKNSFDSKNQAALEETKKILSREQATKVLQNANEFKDNNVRELVDKITNSAIHKIPQYRDMSSSDIALSEDRTINAIKDSVEKEILNKYYDIHDKDEN